MSPIARPDLTNTSPVVEIGPFPQWFEPEKMVPHGATLYARLCGETLARAHGRTGDRVAIAAYLGRSDRFDRALADFAAKYADQNERDYESFVAAVRDGRLSALEGV